MVFAVFIVNRKQPLDEESEILYFFFFRSKRLKKDSLLGLSIHFLFSCILSMSTQKLMLVPYPYLLNIFSPAVSP